MNIYKLNWGGTIIVDTVNSILTATKTQLIFRKPGSATEITVTAVIADATHLTYLVPVGFFDTPGKWLVQPYNEFGTASGGRGDTDKFYISNYME